MPSAERTKKVSHNSKKLPSSKLKSINICQMQWLLVIKETVEIWFLAHFSPKSVWTLHTLRKFMEYFRHCIRMLGRKSLMSWQSTGIFSTSSCIQWWISWTQRKNSNLIKFMRTLWEIFIFQPLTFVWLVTKRSWRSISAMKRQRTWRRCAKCLEKQLITLSKSFKSSIWIGNSIESIQRS